MTLTAEPTTTSQVRSGHPVARARDPRSPSRTFAILSTVVVTLFALIWLVPFAWAIVTSLRPEGEITANPTSWWTSHWTFSAYTDLIDTTDIGWWYLNSFVTSALAAALTVVVCSMMGFALARTRFRGRTGAAGVVLAGLMIPGQVLVLPQFEQFRALGLLNTWWAIVLPAIATPVAVFVFASFMSGIPDSLIESARIDGASWWTIYRRICMPLCKPAISAVVIFTFVTAWNNFLWPLLALSNTAQMTLPVGLATTQSSFGVRYASAMAGAVLGLIPLVAVFLLFQRRIVQGIASTGIK
jgi:multiple sugar transport system permease protein